MFKENPKLKKLIVPSIAGIFLGAYQSYQLNKSITTTLIITLVLIAIVFGIIFIINKMSKNV